MKTIRSRSCGGLTLVEVLAALAILGTLLSALMMASVRLERQRVIARQKLEAVEAVEDLLESWSARVAHEAGPEEPGGAEPRPLPRSGRIDDRYRWRLETVDEDVLGAGQVVRARLEVYPVADDNERSRPLVSVDLFLPERGEP